MCADTKIELETTYYHLPKDKPSLNVGMVGVSL